MTTPQSPTSRPTPSPLAGRLWVLAAALLWSTSGLFAKSPIFLDWPEAVRGPLFAFWRAFFASLVLVPTIRRPRWKGHLLPLAGCFVIMNVTYLVALTRTTAANAIWLQATAPWWVFLFSIFLLGERIVGRDLIPLVFGFVGVGTILLFEIRGQQQAGVLCGLASGMTFAAVLMFMRRLRRENPAWLVALNHAVTALVLVPWILYLGRWPSLGQLAVLAGFGAVQMGVPYTFMIRGLRSIRSQEAVAIALAEPVLMPIWVWLVWQEEPAWWTVAGASLIFAGLVLRYVVWELAFGPKDVAAED